MQCKKMYLIIYLEKKISYNIFHKQDIIFKLNTFRNRDIKVSEKILKEYRKKTYYFKVFGKLLLKMEHIYTHATSMSTESMNFTSMSFFIVY